MSDRNSRRGAAWRWSAFVLGGLLLCGSAAYAAWPWLIAAAGRGLAGPLGVEELHLQVGRPGGSGMVVHEVRIVVGGIQVWAAGGRVAYRMPGLAQGRLEAAHFDRMRVRILPREEDEASVAGAPPSVEGLFAALPVSRVEVADLVLEVPALDFLARGHLQLTESALEARLAGERPEQGRGLELLAQVSRAGVIDLRLGDGHDAPFLQVTSAFDGPMLTVTGQFDLRGFAFDLVAELARLPSGDGRVSGHFDAALPWPAPDPPDWLALPAHGAVRADWQGRHADYRLQGLIVNWRLETGRLRAAGAAQGHSRGRAFAVQAAVDDFDPRGGTGRGSLRLAPIAAPDGAPYGTATWQLGAGELRVQGDYHLRDELLALVAEEVGGLPGTGSLSGGATLQVPWPVGSDVLSSLTAAGTVAGQWSWPEQDAAVADLEGSWNLADGHLDGHWRGEWRYGAWRSVLGLSLEPVDLAAPRLALRGQVDAGPGGRLPFAASWFQGAGTLQARGALDLHSPLAAGLIEGWVEPYDVVAGRLGLDVDLGWPAWPDLGGSVRVSLDDLTAHYQDYVARGLQGALEFRTAGGAWWLQPATLQVAALELGVTLEDVQIGIGWRGDAVSVMGVTARVLGGTLEAAPFVYYLSDGEAYLTLEFEDLDLARILALEGDQVTGTGRISGILPVTLRGNAPRIDGGRVWAGAEGGVLQVSSELAGGAGMPGLDFALRALQDFRYAVLRGAVDYSEAGDLALAVRLEGRNPEVEDGRPIHYNLNVTENIPMLLRSLRLEDEVTRGIERRLTN